VAGLGIEGLALAQFRAARSASDARGALGSTRYVQRVMGLSLVTAIVTGLYLATAYWSWRGAWMGMAILAIVAMGLVGGLMTGRTTTRLLRTPGEGLGAAEIVAAQGRLTMAYVIRLGLFLGIVFLMTTKPASGSIALLVVVIAAVAGVLAGLPAGRIRGTARA
jgi:FtsH-binding integral membrane protein